VSKCDVTTVAFGNRTSLCKCSAQVKVQGVPAWPRELSIGTGSVILGSASTADIAISDASVSRNHLRITIIEDGIELLDLDSRNGTYFQGVRISRLILDREAHIVLGRVKVTIEPRVQYDPSTAGVQTDPIAQLTDVMCRVLNFKQPYQQLKDQIVNCFLDLYLSMILDKTGGNQSEASRISGIDRTYLNKMIAKTRRGSNRAPSGTRPVAPKTKYPAKKRGLHQGEPGRSPDK
jgi:DNA-binding protein Fis